jgi:hypothetical protein
MEEIEAKNADFTELGNIDPPKVAKRAWWYPKNPWGSKANPSTSSE